MDDFLIARGLASRPPAAGPAARLCASLAKSSWNWGEGFSLLVHWSSVTNVSGALLDLIFKVETFFLGGGLKLFFYFEWLPKKLLAVSRFENNKSRREGKKLPAGLFFLTFGQIKKKDFVPSIFKCKRSAGCTTNCVLMT
jgi:hypothetical protein